MQLLYKWPGLLTGARMQCVRGGGGDKEAEIRKNKDSKDKLLQKDKLKFRLSKQNPLNSGK